MLTQTLFWLTATMPAKAIDLGGKYYIERYHVLTRGKLTILLHRYLGCDGDRHEHNHPHRWSLGIPLRGGYTEERVIALCPNRGILSRMVRIRPWRWNIISHNRLHRVAHVEPFTWTLFITWHRYKFWGELLRNPNHNKQLIFRAVPGTQETSPTWYKTALSGRELRRRRGTNTPPPSRIFTPSNGWLCLAMLALFVSMNIPGA